MRNKSDATCTTLTDGESHNLIYIDLWYIEVIQLWFSSCILPNLKYSHMSAGREYCLHFALSFSWWLICFGCLGVPPSRKRLTGVAPNSSGNGNCLSRGCCSNCIQISAIKLSCICTTTLALGNCIFASNTSIVDCGHFVGICSHATQLLWSRKGKTI